MPDAIATSIWAPAAWIDGQWRDSVLLQIDASGHWSSVQAGVAAVPEATVLTEPVLPGVVNSHSHAFQRAFAGLAERRESDHDDFWSWRNRMYDVALRITPEQQYAIAAQLFLELLHGGYTQVCEFHYLHRTPGGGAFADDLLKMAHAICDAARDVGIGLTLLPVVYERAGFATASPREDQRRFAADGESVLAMRDALRREAGGLASSPARPQVMVGAALHSLRAATPRAIEILAKSADPGPIHIHVAEQTGEVDECLAATGLRPIEWLIRHVALDRRWQLVHATHSIRSEIEAVSKSGAGIVLCPSTEANLGDGIPDLAEWLERAVPISIGSDSHVCRCWLEELRLLEYAQRLSLRARCIAAAPQFGISSTAARLLPLVSRSGATAAGFDTWGFVVGARADLLVLDTTSPALLGIPLPSILDALVFSGPVRGFRDVMVAGRWAVRGYESANEETIRDNFVRTMQELNGNPDNRRRQ